MRKRKTLPCEILTMQSHFRRQNEFLIPMFLQTFFLEKSIFNQKFKGHSPFLALDCEYTHILGRDLLCAKAL